MTSLQWRSPSTVLAAVVLLFHQDEQFVERPEGGAVFILKIRERLKQTNGGYAALVFKKIAHGMMMKRLSCKCGVSAARRWCFLFALYLDMNAAAFSQRADDRAARTCLQCGFRVGWITPITPRMISPVLMVTILR